MEVTSGEVLQDRGCSQDSKHDTENPTSVASDGDGENSEVKSKPESLVLGASVDTSILEAIQPCSLEDCNTTQPGESSRLDNVQVDICSQAHDYLVETQGAIGAESAVPFDLLQDITDRILEHSSDSGSKTKVIYTLNKGSKSVGRQKERRQRSAGAVKVLKTLSSSSQPVKLNDIADSISKSSEDNDNKSSTKNQSKKRTPVATIACNENDTSTARRQSHRGDEERTLGTPARRLAFATLQPSDLNIRLGTTPNQTPEKFTPSKIVATKNLTPIKAAPTTSVEQAEVTSPILSLQQPGSVTSQILTTEDESDIESEYAEENLSILAEDHSDKEDTIEAALESLSLQIYGPDDPNEHHDSDKENMPVHEMFLPGSGSVTMKMPRELNMVGCPTREPLQTLYSAPSPSVYQSPDIFTPASSERQHQTVPKWQARCQVKESRLWHIVADTNCFLDADSLKALTQLEGVHETRLAIPHIVVRELDFFQNQEHLKARAGIALQWIEACMLKNPFWIHVQSSAETLHLAMTPPVSPFVYSRGLEAYRAESNLMNPTFTDYILEYTLLLHKTVPNGRVALLTDVTTLKIKAMAEGLVVDTAVNFIESLLNPYSHYFVYAGSTPIGRSCSHHEISYGGLSTPRSTISSSSPCVRSLLRASPRPDTPRPTLRASFSTLRGRQPLGLQVLLT